MLKYLNALPIAQGAVAVENYKVASFQSLEN
jgi:hypothetical protein